MYRYRYGRVRKLVTTQIYMDGFHDGSVCVFLMIPTTFVLKTILYSAKSIPPNHTPKAYPMVLCAGVLKPYGMALCLGNNHVITSHAPD